MKTFPRGLTTALVLTATLAAAPLPARAGLDDYVKKADPAFAWSHVKTTETPQGTVHNLKLTSQNWQGIDWVHNFQVFEPKELTHSESALLFITGGSIHNLTGIEGELGFSLARLCGARVFVLPQVPNQPLLGDKSEDTLIAETFVRYLETKDESWPLLFPMVKSAVKAMDAAQEWARKEGKPEIKRFVVTGASKRGWTTWLTGASDPRVIGIAPMVIDTLNMKAQFAHAMEVWGRPSEQIEDYTNRGLTKRLEDREGQKLWMMVDPYTYRKRLTLPKLIINGANDRYWTLDALNLYWDDLVGPRSVVYLPNAGHNMAVHRDYATHGVGAFFRHLATGRAWPSLSWDHGNDGDGGLTLTVKSDPEPKSARLWVIKSDTRDFRDAKWEPAAMTVTGSVVKGATPRPEQGYIALMGDLEYEVDGIPYHLSTQIRQTGAKGTEKTTK